MHPLQHPSACRAMPEALQPCCSPAAARPQPLLQPCPAQRQPLQPGRSPAAALLQPGPMQPRSRPHPRRRYSRRLIVMEKVRPYDAAAAAAYHEAAGPPVTAIDQIHDLVYEKIKDERGKVVVPERYHSAPKFRGKAV